VVTSPKEYSLRFPDGARHHPGRFLQEVNMLETRREFLHVSAAFAVCAITVPLSAQQVEHGMPIPPQHLGPSDTEQPATTPKLDPRMIMQEHEKDFREKLDELYAKVQELKKDADSTPTADIFSVKIYKQTKEIETLAKQLKKLAKS
jgi:hypothetical protein